MHACFFQQQAEEHPAATRGADWVGEQTLFHYVPERFRETLLRQGFDPRLSTKRAGEYGHGTYFAHDAVYCLAYAGGWLEDKENVAKHMLADRGQHVEHQRLSHVEDNSDCTCCLCSGCTCATEQLGDKVAVERRAEEMVNGAPSKISLLYTRVALGHCKDFEGRCASNRCIGERIAEEEWPKEGGKSWVRPPPRDASTAGGPAAALYDSICGTEGDLEWVAHPELRKHGKQYVVYNGAQAYPELVIHLERRAPLQEPEPEPEPETGDVSMLEPEPELESDA